MQNYFNKLEEALKKDKRFLAEDGTLLKVRVREAADSLDPNLLRTLKNNDTLNEVFFTEVDGILVFDKAKFNWILESREFLPDSYTAFKNKIGLAGSRGELISQQNDVTLVWPYKDCVLEGGQTSEDRGQDEVFYNETLAPQEVRRLLYPKAFKNAKRYTKDGVKDITEFNENDNLIIKGNNLLVLSSLLERYEGQVKCVYIDPPYNTQNDGFRYNDRFNHSTWLTFMKNRLELAKRLLRDDGVIFVQCDDNEQAYLKVLMDGVFGIESFDSCITTIVKPEGRRYGNLAKTHEYILVYAKKSGLMSLNELAATERKFSYRDDIGEFNLRELRNQNTVAFNSGNRPNLRYPFYVNTECIDDQKLLKVSVKPLDGWTEIWPITTKNLDSVWRWGKEKASELQDELCARRGSDSIIRIYQKVRSTTQMEKTVWFGDPNLISNKGTKEIQDLFGDGVFSFPKPEALLQKILDLGSEDSDLVLDFHLGSGTTAAVAHKMGRRYIGVEQMDYIEDITVERLKKVIEGEQGGISKAQNWQGGGSFVYFELAEYGETLMSALQNAETSEEILALLDKITDNGMLKPAVLPDDMRKHREDIAAMPLDEQKRLVAEIIDKNKLYVNACDIDDAEHGLREADRAFTKSFYGVQED